MTTPRHTMRSEAECLAMAVDLERRAGRCSSITLSAEFFYLAHYWRHVASQAAWQDAAA